MPGDYAKKMEEDLAGKMGEESDTDEYSKITVKIKVCGDSWAELRKRLPALFK
jgi:hypothetical protein